MVRYRNNILEMNGKLFQYEEEIKAIFNYNSLFVIFLAGRTFPKNNIFAISKDGVKIWSIEEIIRLGKEETYVNAQQINEEELEVISSSGILSRINVFTHEVIKKSILK